MIDQQQSSVPEAIASSSIFSPAGRVGSTIQVENEAMGELARVPQLNQRKLVPMPRGLQAMQARR